MEMEEDLKEEKYVAVEVASVDSSGSFNQNEVLLTTNLVQSNASSMKTSIENISSDLTNVNLKLGIDSSCVNHYSMGEETNKNLQKINNEDLTEQSHREIQINTHLDIYSYCQDDSRHLNRCEKRLANAVSDDDLTCAICFQLLKSPKLLPCLHSFCLVCLETLYNPVGGEENLVNVEFVNGSETGREIQKGDNSSSESCAAANYSEVSVEKFTLRSQKAATIKCPVCKEKCEVPLRGIDGLMTNTMLVNMVKAKEKLTQKAQCEICKLRDIVEEAVAFCTDCTDMLCKSCWQSHLFTRFTLTHKIVPLEEMEDHIHGDVLRNLSSIMCESHFNEVLKYFCTDCSKLLCRECLLLDHQGHSCIPSSNAADDKRRDLKILIHGLKERFDSLRKEESEEYQVQMDRIATAEDSELQKINNFCDSLITAIEKERQNALEKIKSEFLKISGHCKHRFVSFQNMEKKMSSAISVVSLVESISNDEEFLHVEPIVHHRLVKLVNLNVDPCPVSWYTLPKTDHLNPVTIKCSATENIDLANVLFETMESKRHQVTPIDLVLNDETLVSLADLYKAGRFKRPSSQSSIPPDNNVQDQDRAAAAESNFVDATIWPQCGSSKNEHEFRDLNPSNNRTVLGSSCSSSSDSAADDHAVIEKKEGKKKRGKRGGRKKKGKKEVVDTQNLLKKTSSQQSLLVNQASFSLGNSNLLQFANTNNTTQMTYSSMASGFSSIYGSNPGAAIAAGSHNFGSINQLNRMPFAMFRPAVQPPQSQSAAMFGNKKIQLTSGTDNRSQTPTKNNPSNQSVNTTSSSVVKRLISLQPKWRLDVKLSSDMYEPNLTGVFCHQKVSIVVSDIKNSKVKIFSTKGEFVRFIEVKKVGRAILASNTLIYSSKNTVSGRKDDGNVINTMIFGDKGDCFVTWFPKGSILVGKENKIRQYSIDHDKGNFVKTRNISIEGGSIQQIVDIRCDMSGHKVVVVDSNTKSVVILNVDNHILGTYVEKDNSVWNPTSACFDRKGNVFVADGGGNRLLLLSQTGAYIQQWDTSPTIYRPNFVTTNQTEPLYLTGHDRYVHVYDYTYM